MNDIYKETAEVFMHDGPLYKSRKKLLNRTYGRLINLCSSKRRKNLSDNLSLEIINEQLSTTLEEQKNCQS